MELKELKCKNCGANLKVEPNAKDVTCNFCHTTFSVETMENTGYEFEKGRIKAQKEEWDNKVKATKDAFDNAAANFNSEDFSKTAKSMGIIFTIVAVVIFVVAAVFMVMIFSNFNKVEKKANSGMSFEERSKMNSFNNDFKMYEGSEPLAFVKNALELAVIANQKGEHKVTVVYKDIKTTDPDEIIDLKNSLTNSKYGISYDYDKVGYINKLTLMDV